MSVALFNDTAVIGAPLDDDNGEDSGSACVFAGLSDRNRNGALDTCDIASGFSEDNNGNGVPDECEALGDMDGDGDVDLADLAALLAAYGSRIGDPAYNPYADIDGDSDVDLSDPAELLAHYGEGTWRRRPRSHARCSRIAVADARKARTAKRSCRNPLPAKR